MFSLLRQKESGGISSSAKPLEKTSNFGSTSDLCCNKMSTLNVDDLKNNDALSIDKKSLIQEKMHRLQKYGNPPPIQELPALHSPLIKKEFKAPFRSITKIKFSPPMSPDSYYEKG